ncbi:transmembrane protein 143-like isoform X2 [Mytilus galloprovincialis]|uniref:transmembrane protein 143-like isoform X2 n=1 Tax=Mytilus galloprovincialis TaxID=29158 RepID=UPI003F7C1021
MRQTVQSGSMAVLLLSRKAGLAKQVAKGCLLNHEFTICSSKAPRHYHLKTCQHIQWRTISTTRCVGNDKLAETSDPKNEVVTAPVLEVEEEEDLYKERYIPLTRQSLIRLLVEEKAFLSESEKKIYTDFAVGLDSAIVNKYHGILHEIKALFDPINPDKDAVKTRKYTRREKLDNEFWLLQRLEDLVEKANFHELSENTLIRSMNEHDVSEGVRVKVDRNNFDILRIWALGKEKPEMSIPWYRKLQFWKTPVKKTDGPAFYKRVVVALRLKKDQKLMLKVYKEVPVNGLEMLLPDGRIVIKSRDKQIIAGSAFLAMSSVLAKCVTILAHLNIDWFLVVFITAGMIGGRTYTVYNNRKNKYLARLNRQLYFKNVANNRGSLALLVDRAEDESFKEALMAYTFLLTNRSVLAMKKDVQFVPTELGNITDLHLERKCEEWIEKKTGAKIEFDSSEAIKHLQDFGILSKLNGKLNVLPLDSAMRNLPQQPSPKVERMEEDLLEGYDRDYFLETEEKYTEEENKDKKYGWF